MPFHTRGGGRLITRRFEENGRLVTDRYENVRHVTGRLFEVKEGTPPHEHKFDFMAGFGVTKATCGFCGRALLRAEIFYNEHDMMRGYYACKCSSFQNVAPVVYVGENRYRAVFPQVSMDASQYVRMAVEHHDSVRDTVARFRTFARAKCPV